MNQILEFTYRRSRSGAITSAIIAVIVIESVAVHFAVAARRPMLAWALSLSSVAAVVWLVRDYLALGAGAIQLSDDTLRLRIGRRFDISVPLVAIVRTIRPTFRDLPAPGTNQGRDYLNLTRPAAPNVLIGFEPMIRVRLTAGLHRDVARVGLQLDDPAAFLAALDERRGTCTARQT